MTMQRQRRLPWNRRDPVGGQPFYVGALPAAGAHRGLHQASGADRSAALAACQARLDVSVCGALHVAVFLALMTSSLVQGKESLNTLRGDDHSTYGCLGGIVHAMKVAAASSHQSMLVSQ